MRKFRAWDSIEQKMYYKGFYICPNGDLIWRNDAAPFQNSYVLEQFTGLLDKNGIDLDWWEGDMLDWCGQIGSIIFSEGSFWFSPKDTPDEWEYMHMLADDHVNIKKISNIHEEQK